MDLIEHYTELSKKEIMEIKEISEFKKSLDCELIRATNIKYNTIVIKKLMHPILTIRNNCNYKRLLKIDSDFNFFLNSDVLQYVVEETGELATDLDYAARYHKPKVAVEYVKSLKKNTKKLNK